MIRPTEQKVLMGVAEAWATRSTCNRMQVGAVLAYAGRIISTGYNGAPPGAPHCPPVEPEPCDRTVHAEANALAFAARYGIATDGASLFTTLSPCMTCAKQMVSAGVKDVYYRTVYRDTSALAWLADMGVPVYQEDGGPLWRA